VAIGPAMKISSWKVTSMVYAAGSSASPTRSFHNTRRHASNGGAPSPASRAPTIATPTPGTKAINAKPTVDAVIEAQITGGWRQRSASRASMGWPIAMPAVNAPTSMPASEIDMVCRANSSSASGPQPIGSRPSRLLSSTRGTARARSTSVAALIYYVQIGLTWAGLSLGHYRIRVREVRIGQGARSPRSRSLP
jgi:hypothetical protein